MKAGIVLLAVIIGLLLVAIAAIGGIVFYLWYRKRGEKKEKNLPLDQSDAVEEIAVAKGKEQNLKQYFFSSELLELFDIAKVDELLSDDCKKTKKLQAVIVNANIAGFEEMIRERKVDEVYEIINETLSCCIPAIYEHGGIIDHFQDAGVLALFVEQKEEALKAAISICENMMQEATKEDYRNFSIALSYGTVMAGIVGDKERLSILTLSSYAGLGAFLQRQAPLYYATILATQHYIRSIKGFEQNYNYRLLGYFYVKAVNQLEAIYDVFDGDTANIRNKKRKTKMLFEKGVTLFIEREFLQARSYFIEVLKADRNDLAAREYVFLCDKYAALSPEEQQNVKIYIEYY